MTISLAVNGKSYKNFEGARVTQSITNLCDDFTFSVSNKSDAPFPFVGGEECTVFVDNVLILTGHIERINVNGAAKKHTIDVGGRDRCGDLIDSMLGPDEDIAGTMSLLRLCERAIANVGLSIKVFDFVKPKPFQVYVDLSSPDPGQTIWDYLEPLSRARQVLLTSNAQGNLTIARSSGTVAEGAFVEHRVTDIGRRNNVLEYSAKRDFTARHREYRNITSLSAPANALSSIGLGAEYISAQLAIVRDPLIRRGRQFVITEESGLQTGDGQDRARWERDTRIANSNGYVVKVDGHTDPAGNRWKPNTIIPVRSDYAGINDNMLVAKVEFSQEPGSFSTLTLLDKNAFTLQVSEPTEEPVGEFV